MRPAPAAWQAGRSADENTGQTVVGTLHGLRQAASTKDVQRYEWVLLNDDNGRIELRGNLTIEAEDGDQR